MKYVAEWGSIILNILLPFLGYIIGIRKSKYDADKSGADAIQSLRKSYLEFIEDYNKKYEIFKNEIATLEVKVSDLEKYNTKLQIRITELDKHNAELQYKISDLEKYNQELKSRVSEL